jgi:hypothetical protein
MNKPGWQTTEWWTTMVAQVLAFLTVLHVFTPAQAHNLEQSLTAIIGAVFLLAANAWIVVHYIKARLAIKSITVHEDNRDDQGGSGPTLFRPSVNGLLPFVLPVLAFAFLGAPAQAQTSILPWRNSIHDRIRRLEDQTQRQQAAPQAAPAPAQPPVIIMMPPLQQLPIAGEPKQQLPIQGAPKQDLPIPGEPKQPLPIPGVPLQPLPTPGAPKQELPPAGQPKQTPPQGDQPKQQFMPPATGYQRFVPALWRPTHARST